MDAPGQVGSDAMEWRGVSWEHVSSPPLPRSQEPSVTMLDWSTGLGTAKYWVNDLLLGAFAQGGWALASTPALLGFL